MSEAPGKISIKQQSSVSAADRGQRSHRAKCILWTEFTRLYPLCDRFLNRISDSERSVGPNKLTPGQQLGAVS